MLLPVPLTGLYGGQACTRPARWVPARWGRVSRGPWGSHTQTACNQVLAMLHRNGPKWWARKTAIRWRA